MNPFHYIILVTLCLTANIVNYGQSKYDFLNYKNGQRGDFIENFFERALDPYSNMLPKVKVHYTNPFGSKYGTKNFIPAGIADTLSTYIFHCLQNKPNSFQSNEGLTIKVFDFDQYKIKMYDFEGINRRYTECYNTKGQIILTYCALLYASDVDIYNEDAYDNPYIPGGNCEMYIFKYDQKDSLTRIAKYSSMHPIENFCYFDTINHNSFVRPLPLVELKKK